MKKAISVILAAVMMFAMCLPAFAEEGYVDAVPGEEYAKLTPNQKFLADAFFKVFNDNEKSRTVKYDGEGNRESASANELMPYFAEHIADELDFDACPDASGLKETLDDDVKAALKAVLLDAGYKIEKGEEVQSKTIANFILPGSGPTINAISTKLEEATRPQHPGVIWDGGPSVTGLEENNPLAYKMAKLVVKYLRDNPEKDVKTDANRKALADYVYRNFVDRDQLYEVYEAEESVDSVVEEALSAVWEDNLILSALLGDRSQLGGDYDENGLPTQAKITERFDRDFKNRAGKDKIAEFIAGIFPGFNPSDFEDMFKGFGDSLLRVGSAVSGLLGSLFGDLFGGGSKPVPPAPPAPPAPPDSDGSGPSEENFSNTKTGDTALYAVLGLAAAAGVALVLTKKKKRGK